MGTIPTTLKIKVVVIVGNLICKSNLLVSSKTNLSLLEQRVINLAILKYRDMVEFDGYTANEVVLHVTDYTELYECNVKTVYKAFEKSANTLSTTTFYVKDTPYQYVTSATYSSGYLTLTLTDDFINTIVGSVKLFTTYDIANTKKLSAYATRLYEVIEQWKNTKRILISVEKLRDVLGVLEGKYKFISSFKKFVIDKALKQIEKHTGYIITYTQKKIGKCIKSFEFKISKQVTNTVDCGNVEHSQATSESTMVQTHAECSKTPPTNVEKGIGESSNFWDKPLTPKQVSKIAINFKSFVEDNLHLMSPNFRGNYLDLFEYYKPLMQSDSISKFKRVGHYLGLQKV